MRFDVRDALICNSNHLRFPVFFSVLLMGVMVPAMAQPSDPDPASGTPEVRSQQGQEDDAPAQAPTPPKNGVDTRQQSRGSFIAGPLPISSPALGTGIIPVLGYIFPLTKDTLSPPSTVAAAGLFTDNGTRAFALGAQLFFGQNRYKVTAGYARGNLNYDVYGPGLFSVPQAKLPLEQTGQVFRGEFLRRIWWDFFLGLRFFDGSSIISLKTSSPDTAVLPPGLGLHTGLRAIGFRLQRDTRPNHYYPISGTLTDFTADFFAEAIGSKYGFQSYNLTFNKYGSLTGNQVLAFSSFFCATGGQPPFYGNCIYGVQNQLRGYTAGATSIAT
jgi:Omp85 superfamily domain